MRCAVKVVLETELRILTKDTVETLICLTAIAGLKVQKVIPFEQVLAVENMRPGGDPLMYAHGEFGRWIPLGAAPGAPVDELDLSDPD